MFFRFQNQFVSHPLFNEHFHYVLVIFLQFFLSSGYLNETEKKNELDLRYAQRDLDAT